MLISMCNLVRTLLVVFMSVSNSILINAKTINETSVDLKSCLLMGEIDEYDIIFRDDVDVYNKLNYQWNKWSGNITPMAYVKAKTDADIRTAVICCKLLNIRIVVRSGGHSFDKRCYGDSDSLVVDLSAMNQISIDTSEMYCDIGAGARAALITYTLWNNGKYMTPLGICPTVGIAGLALGGGFGYFTRTLGLASDNLVELQMIDANGNLQICNKNTNDDLFWALRGGGGGSFGIVTKLKFRMYKAPKSVIYGNYYYHVDHFHQFYEAYQSLISAPSIRDNFGLLITVRGDIITMEVYVIDFENAKTMSVDVDKILGSFTFPKAIKSLLQVLSYPDFYMKTVQPYSPLTTLTDLSQLKDIDQHFTAGFLQCKSMFVQKILSKNEISELQALLKPVLLYSTLFFEHNGGVIDDYSRTETAFVHRNNLYSLQLDTFFEKFNHAAVSAINTFYEASKHLLNHQESYQNYVDPAMVDYLQRYYGENLKKLIKIKTKFDPDNFFHHPQSIPTAKRSTPIIFM